MKLTPITIVVLLSLTGQVMARWHKRHRIHHNHHSYHPHHYSHSAYQNLTRERQLRSAAFTKPDECPQRVGISDGDRICERKCATDSDCKNERKMCLCDGNCGLSCIRPAQECPELPDPPHGQVLVTGR